MVANKFFTCFRLINHRHLLFNTFLPLKNNLAVTVYCNGGLKSWTIWTAVSWMVVKDV